MAKRAKETIEDNFEIDLSAPAELLKKAIDCHGAGQMEMAENLYSAILQGNPDHADALHLLGLINHQRGNYHAAGDFISRAITNNPKSPEFHNSLGAVKQALGDKETAIRLYIHAIELKDDYLEPYRNLLRLCPDSVDIHFNLGCVLHRQKKFPEAIKQYEKVIAIQPSLAKAYNNMGCALRELGRFNESVSCLRQAVGLQPDYDEAHSNLGLSLHDNGMSEEAVNSYNTALFYKADSPGVYCNLGQALHHLGRHEDAITHYKRATEIDPALAKAYYSWGCVLDVIGRYSEAIEKHQKAIQLKSDYVEAHVNRALLFLRTGRYLEGWPEYEWRLQRVDWRSANSYYPELPRWDGSQVMNKCILVQAEQGFGDTIQFSRYLPMVKQLCGKLIVEAQPELHSLLATMPAIDELLERKSENARKADIAIHIMSLPGIFRTTTKTIPSSFPYLHVPQQQREVWRQRISHEGIKIGITWSGNLSNPENQERSCDLAHFATLAAIPSVHLFSLQKGEAAKQIDNCSADMAVIDLGPHLHDFADTAAAIMQLDLIISVDTALVHLAGAMNRLVWTLRYHIPYWVWGTEGKTTPWYNSMRIFRQKRPDDWDGVFRQVATELKKVLHQAGGEDF